MEPECEKGLVCDNFGGVAVFQNRLERRIAAGSVAPLNSASRLRPSRYVTGSRRTSRPSSSFTPNVVSTQAASGWFA